MCVYETGMVCVCVLTSVCMRSVRACVFTDASHLGKHTHIILTAEEHFMLRTASQSHTGCGRGGVETEINQTPPPIVYQQLIQMIILLHAF